MIEPPRTHNAKSDGRPSFYNLLGKRVKHFVRWWRKLDARVNQPLPQGRHKIWTLVAPDGYVWFVPFLAAVLVIAMALGPTFETTGANLALLASVSACS